MNKNVNWNVNERSMYEMNINWIDVCFYSDLVEISYKKYRDVINKMTNNLKPLLKIAHMFAKPTGFRFGFFEGTGLAGWPAAPTSDTSSEKLVPAEPSTSTGCSPPPTTTLPRPAGPGQLLGHQRRLPRPGARWRTLARAAARRHADARCDIARVLD